MHPNVLNSMGSMRVGEAQQFFNLTVFPLFGPEGGLEYYTLSEAMKLDLLSIRETSDAGTVPFLHASCRAKIPILLMDGEELAGAKQNRVVNATFLLAPESETDIDVSCTERGRWSYRSDRFDDSEVMMAHKIRMMKHQAVSRSLHATAGFRADQGEIWEGIEGLHTTTGGAAPTRAMRDAYVATAEKLEEGVKAFPLVEGQVGLCIVVDGAVVSLDFVSRKEAYRVLHEKLVKSFLIDSTVRKDPGAEAASPEAVTQFLTKLSECAESGHPSRGCGTDFRYEHDKVSGSALVYEDTCVHATFFAVDNGQRGPGRRRSPRRFDAQ